MKYIGNELDSFQKKNNGSCGAVSCAQIAWSPVKNRPRPLVTLREGRCLATPPGPLAPVSHNPHHTHPTPAERCVPISHMCNVPSSWYSVWTPPPQLPGNSQVGLAHYKRGCLPPLLSLTFVLLPLSLASCPLVPLLSSFRFPPLSTWSWPASISLLSPSLCLSLPLLPS